MSNFDTAEIVLDKLKSMSDSELYSLHKKYKELIFEASYKQLDAQKLEIECCYLQRELELRRRFGGNLNNSQ